MSADDNEPYERHSSENKEQLATEKLFHRKTTRHCPTQGFACVRFRHMYLKKRRGNTSENAWKHFCQQYRSYHLYKAIICVHTIVTFRITVLYRLSNEVNIQRRFRVIIRAIIFLFLGHRTRKEDIKFTSLMNCHWQKNIDRFYCITCGTRKTTEIATRRRCDSNYRKKRKIVLEVVGERERR